MSSYTAVILSVIVAAQFLGGHAALQKATSGWASPIRYRVDPGLSDKTKGLIDDLLTNYIPSLVPGLSFIKETTAPVGSHLDFDHDPSRKFCEDENLQIGPVSGAATVVSITENSNVKCGRKGWILHLVMHALGFYHEHQRADRDNYVFVNSGNSVLKDPAKAALLDIKNSGVVINSAPYDYMSATHYHYDATAQSGKRTIVALPAEYYSIKSYGHATNLDYTDDSVLSKGDIAALQALFPGTPVTVPNKVCSNGGTWHNWCLCKPGFAGRQCTETYCYQQCQNSGYCGINPDTRLPGCVCPTGYSGTYCEIMGSSPNCSSVGQCPWWSSCNQITSSCECNPYPYHGPTCAIATIAVPTASTLSPPTTAGPPDGSSEEASTTPDGDGSTTSGHPAPCTATNVGAPRSVTFARNAVYLRVALKDIRYRREYSNLGSPKSVALQNFLAEALQGDYQTQTDGKFISVHIQNIQPPVPGTDRGCTVVDYLARFTSNLTPMQRTNVVQATYAKSTTTNLYSLFGTLGNDRNKATIVSSVLYITPLNAAISPASPCVVFSSEGACENGGSCTASGVDPECVCRSGYRGRFCESGGSPSGVRLNWPIWQIVVVSIAAAIAVILVILLVVFCVRQGQNCNWNNQMSPDRFYGYDMGVRQMPMTPGGYMVPSEHHPMAASNMYPQPAGGMPPPYNYNQRPKHYQYPYNIQ